MKKLILVVIFLFGLISCIYGAPPVRQNTYIAGEIIDEDDVMANEDAIFDYLTAGVDHYVDDSITSADILDGDVDISTDTNLTASTGITLTGDNLTCDLGTSIDISSETNLTAGTNITLSGDTLNVDDAFLKNDQDDTTTGSITAHDVYANNNVSGVNAVMTNTVTGVVVDTQYLEHSSGTDLTIRDSLVVNGRGASTNPFVIKNALGNNALYIYEEADSDIYMIMKNKSDVGQVMFDTEGTNYLLQNTGIGTNTPSHKLDVSGNATISEHTGLGASLDFGYSVNTGNILATGIVVTTGNHLTLGTTQWDDGSDKIDGERIADDTIDDDSIDFGDVTGVDLTLTDCGAITITTGNKLTVGTVQYTIAGADTIDGEQIANDTIDDDSIDFGDVTGADLTLTDCGVITSSETITSSGIFDATGAVAMTIGSVDITSMTFTTDGTGNAEFTFPADVIGTADIDWGAGAGQVDTDDVPEGSTNLYQLTEEEVEDYAGTMVTGGTETRISVTYTDGAGSGDGVFNFVVDDMNDDQPDDDSEVPDDITIDSTKKVETADTVTGSVVDTQYLEYSGGDLTLRGNISMPYPVKTQPKTISVTITKPKDLDEADTLPIWRNEHGVTFTIDAIYSNSDTDDVAFTLKEITDSHDFTALTTIEAITISTDGTGVYYNDLTTGIDHTTIETGHIICFDNDATDDPNYVHILIKGHF